MNLADIAKEIYDTPRSTASILRAISAAGFSPQTKDAQGNTILHYFMEKFVDAYNAGEAISSQDLARALQGFKDVGLDFSAQNNAGKSPLDSVQHINTTQNPYEEALRSHRVAQATPAVRDVVAQGRAAGAPGITNFIR